jgi:BON domain
MLFELKRISTALGLLAVTASAAMAQGTSPTANQMTADAVAGSLRASRNIEGYRIEIQAQGGYVTLSGQLANPAQKAEVIGRARRVSGVRGVIDQLQVIGESGILPVQYQPNLAMGFGLHGRGNNYGGDVVYGGSAGSTGAPGAGGAAAAPDGSPVPEGPAGSMGGTQASMPGYPNYAWPSYAPYPNFSAVGYPTAYPWQAWPNIGPFYPYPEVPLDWRAVTLRWDDGIWWLDFKKHYTRPFITPYPFGLWAY